MQKYLILFGLGGFLYGLIEVLWRGYTHWTMMIAGGVCFCLFALISTKLKGIPFLYKCILGSLTVTTVEFVFGCVFNLLLGMEVWNYSHIPLNLFGQICLLFSVLWGFISIIAIPLADKVFNVLSDNQTSAEGRNLSELSAQGLGGN